jgi:hypothetical protein
MMEILMLTKMKDLVPWILKIIKQLLAYLDHMESKLMRRKISWRFGWKVWEQILLKILYKK